jgi:hypothetical protein
MFAVICRAWRRRVDRAPIDAAVARLVPITDDPWQDVDQRQARWCRATGQVTWLHGVGIEETPGLAASNAAATEALINPSCVGSLFGNTSLAGY